ncbi:hypothetical protein VNO77_39243 [Canavalia gladiata]|uniref:Uncharacterized protein n=1 Tax=Canavalia gladiata TaxID=3824 RepID=A0AAN9KA46_CANGL
MDRLALRTHQKHVNETSGKNDPNREGLDGHKEVVVGMEEVTVFFDEWDGNSKRRMKDGSMRSDFCSPGLRKRGKSKRSHLTTHVWCPSHGLLREIKGIPRKLETLSAKGCISLKELDLMVPAEFPEQCHPLRHLILDDCTYLQKITGDLSNLDNFSAKNCSCLASWFSSMLLNQIVDAIEKRVSGRLVF